MQNKLILQIMKIGVMNQSASSIFGIVRKALHEIKKEHSKLSW